ncbi:MAG TPA: AAA family ATPase [Natronosporangium sp.]
MAVSLPLERRPVESAAVRAPVFVGREREAEAIRRALAATPALVLVEGEAGIGKSRLVREALASGPAGRRTSLVATCPPYRESLTLGPVMDALRRARSTLAGLRLSALAGVLRPLFPEWAVSLPPPPEPVADATVARHRLFRALLELLGALGVELLVVDDAHWADDATLEFLLLLTSGQRDVTLDLVVTYRPEEVSAGSLLRRLAARPPAGGRLERVTLGGLDVAATASVVSSMLDNQPVSEAFARFLQETTGGVPLAVEESVRLMIDRADLVRQDGEWMRRELVELHVPPTVRDSVLERLERLSSDAARAVRAAAVLAEAADRTISEVAGLAGPPAGAALSEAVARGLLIEEDHRWLGFRHALVRKAVYEAIPGPERRRLHLRAGEVLEQLAAPPVTQLVRHFREANDTVRWCRYAEQAAELAIESTDYRTAACLLHDALAGADPAPADEIRLTRRLAEVTRFYRDIRLERELVGRLRRLLASGRLAPAEEGELRSRLGWLLMVLRDFPAGRAELERALPLLADRPLETARVLARLGWPGGGLPASTYLRWLRRAAELDVSGIPAAERLALLFNRVSALLQLGDQSGWSLAAELPDAAPTLQERLCVAVSNINIGAFAMSWGRFDESRHRLARARELAEVDGFGWLLDYILVLQARLDWFTGAWAGLLDRVAALTERDDLHPDAQLEARDIAAVLRADCGPRRGVADELRALAEEARRRDVLDRPLMSAARLARMRLEAGDPAEALRLTEETARMAAATGIWLQAAEPVRVRTRALVSVGQADEAARLVSAFGKGISGRDAPGPRAALATCRATLLEATAGPLRAAGAFGRAAAAWERLPRPYDALLAREDQGRCLLAAGRDDEAAITLLTQVFHELSRLGARHDAERVAERLRAHGVEVRREWRRGRRGYGNQLSPRELEVVRVLATGRTNREIAEILSRSPKTVAWQVNSAMRKLGVTTRTGLAVAAVEAGLVDRPDSTSNPPSVTGPPPSKH